MNYDLGGSLGIWHWRSTEKAVPLMQRILQEKKAKGEWRRAPGTIKERKPVPAGYTKRRDCDIGRNRRAGNHQSYMDYCD